MKKGWEMKTLGDVLAKTETIDPTRSPNREFEYIDVSSVSNATLTIQETQRLKGKDAPSRARRIVRSNDVIFATVRPTLRRIAIIPDELDGQVCSTGYFVLRAKPDVDCRFVFYFLQSQDFMHAMEMLQKGASYPAVTDGEVRSQPIPIPALPEQRRIVAVLDEAFAGLATAKANAETNLQNARALFESHLQAVFSQKGEGWVEKTLGETCEMYQPKTIGTKDLVPDGQYPVFGANGVIGRYDKFNHEDPQLLVTCRGATCGSVNVSQPKSWITGNAMVVRPKDVSLDLQFLEFIFRGGIDISVAITGAAQPQITRTNLSPLVIRFPKAVAEQVKLAKQFEYLTSETTRLAAIYQQKLAALESLKKSLLHQAFSGAL